MYHGIINVYKEAGYTSHDVVARLRGICKQKKIGHTGTLDPDAVGVLPVCLGNGTRLCDLLTDKDKEYVAWFRLGMVTDTQDISGKVIEEREVTATEEEVLRVVASFLGDQLQVPPMYSALKVNGKRLYELARQGKEVERAARPIHIHSIEVLEAKSPDYQIRVKCSKGTYIRTLCHDIGQALSCGAVMTKLTRTRVGRFSIEEACTLDALQEAAGEGTLQKWILPVDQMFEEFSSLHVKEESRKRLENGNQLLAEDFLDQGETAEQQKVDGRQFRVYDSRNQFFGVFRYDEKRGFFSPVKMFMV